MEMENNENTGKHSPFNGWVIFIIFLNIILGIISAVNKSFAIMFISPALGWINLAVQVVGIVSLIFLVYAKKWALIVWVCYILAVSVFNCAYSGQDIGVAAIVAILKLGIMFLVLQIRENGVSAWSLIFNRQDK